ncbi:MAG: hypothetical protein HZB26_11620 [Candidatus Hydrogenedentes bacterium]|nr:hypothetical protein [Candidatus Hydrogenedentota bacterium]
MHIRTVTRVKPQSATNIEQMLDIVLQVINVIQAAARLLGIDTTAFFHKNTTT